MIRAVTTSTITRAAPVARVRRRDRAADQDEGMGGVDEGEDLLAAPRRSAFDATGASWTVTGAGASLSSAMQAAMIKLRRGG